MIRARYICCIHALFLALIVFPQEHLRYLVEVSISAFPNANKGTLAKRSFATHFSRLVIPHPEASGSPTLGQGDLTDTWVIGFVTSSVPDANADRSSLPLRP